MLRHQEMDGRLLVRIVPGRLVYTRFALREVSDSKLGETRAQKCEALPCFLCPVLGLQIRTERQTYARSASGHQRSAVSVPAIRNRGRGGDQLEIC